MNRPRSRKAAVFALSTESDVVAYLRDAIDGDHPELVVPALKNAERSEGIAPAARRLGMTEAELRAQVLPRGRPKLDITMKMLHALGLKLTVTA